MAPVESWRKSGVDDKLWMAMPNKASQFCAAMGNESGRYELSGGVDGEGEGDGEGDGSKPESAHELLVRLRRVPGVCGLLLYWSMEGRYIDWIALKYFLLAGGRLNIYAKCVYI